MLAPTVDLDQPNGARVDNALLGGGYNFAVDRQTAATLLAADPTVVDRLCARQTDVRRVTGYALDLGIRQFLHLGCGIPFPWGIHTVIQRRHSSGHVVYVDDDPVVVELIRHAFGEDMTVGACEADPDDLDTVCTHDETRRLVDLAEPMAVVLTRPAGNERDLAGTIAALRGIVAPRSLLAVVPDGRASEVVTVPCDATRAAVIGMGATT